ncbi:unnamed protein product [Boreogadus saida]
MLLTTPCPWLCRGHGDTESLPRELPPQGPGRPRFTRESSAVPLTLLLNPVTLTFSRILISLGHPLDRLEDKNET